MIKLVIRQSLRCFLLLILGFFTQGAWAIVNTQIEPKNPSVGSEFHVIYYHSGGSANLNPDFSPLDKNFIIVSSNKSSQVSVVNGQVDASTRWVVGLVAKRKGVQTLPAIDFGEDRSIATVIDVSKSEEKPSSTKDHDVFLEVSVDKKKAYVQSQVLYKVKLFFARRLSSADFKPPFGDNLVLMKLGNSKTYEVTRDGKAFQVLEQDYAIFPEKSGDIIIQPPVFRGIVENTDYQRIDQILMDVQHPIALSAKPVTLDVQPIPLNYNESSWLPAKSLQLNQQWQGLEKGLKVGQPITRTVTLAAKGLTVSQLPDLTFDGGEHFKAYPEKPTLKNGMIGLDVVGEKKIKVIYIPTQGGELILPEVKIPWWNTSTNKLEIARLAEKQFSVLGGSVSSNKPPAEHRAIPENSKKDLTVNNVTNSAHSTVFSGPALPWVLLVLLLFSWFFYALFRRGWLSNIVGQTKDSDAPTAASLLSVKKKIKQACVKNDKQSVRHSLLEWANSVLADDIKDLTSMTNMINDSAFSEAIAKLQESLYGREQASWDGHALWVSWLEVDKKLTRKNNKAKGRSPLPPLYPT